MDDVSGLRGQLLDLRQALVSGCEDHWILMAPSSLGELAMICSLANGFRRCHGGKVCIVVDAAKVPLLSLFPGRFDVIKRAPIGAMRALTTHGVVDRLRFERGEPQNLWINQNGDGRGLSLYDLYVQHPGRGGLSFDDMTRYAMHLPWETPLDRGAISLNLQIEAAMLADAHGVTPGRSVVLFPANNTNKPADAAFWRELAAAFIDQGKDVFYCVQGGLFQPPGLDIPGRQLHLSPSQAVAVCDIAGHMVSGANGLVLLSLLTRTRFAMDVLLADAACVRGVGDFRPIDPRTASTVACAPAVVDDAARHYAEWEVTGSAADYRDIARRIAGTGVTGPSP